MCIVPGQIPCSKYQQLPKTLTGKWITKMKTGDMTEEEVREIDKETRIDMGL